MRAHLSDEKDKTRRNISLCTRSIDDSNATDRHRYVLAIDNPQGGRHGRSVPTLRLISRRLGATCIIVLIIRFGISLALFLPLIDMRGV